MNTSDLSSKPLPTPVTSPPDQGPAAWRLRLMDLLLIGVLLLGLLALRVEQALRGLPAAAPRVRRRRSGVDGSRSISWSARQ